MPVRKIPKNHLFVTGRHATDRSTEMVEFESPLEKEHMLLLDFDPRVASYEAQPVRIPLPGGKKYVPDLLVTFHPDHDGLVPPSELAEVKTQSHLDLYADEYRVKFAAAKVYAEERGWHFVLRTEVDIRTPRLANLKFLRRYRHEHPAAGDVEQVLALLRNTGPSSSLRLLAGLSPEAEDQAHWLPVLWHLAATRQIAVDLDTAFGGDVPLWLEA